MKQLEAFGIKTRFIRKDITSYNKKLLVKKDATGYTITDPSGNKKHTKNNLNQIRTIAQDLGYEIEIEK